MEERAREKAFSLVAGSLPKACEQINEFSSRVLRTRGGRVGSGMGGLLEALWGYHTNIILSDHQDTNVELGWFPSHQFHDFACVYLDEEWNPETKQGELFRIEAKSMNFGAEESKAHFDVLEDEVDEFDALLLLVWRWDKLDDYRCYPKIMDSFFDLAHPIVKLRDALHLARGGTFVNRRDCPDACPADTCSHHGEPLNEKGKRERLSGPENRRPSSKVAYAANFGGLVRMLKTRSAEAKKVFRRIRREDKVANEYVSFVHRNYPDEEQSHYSKREWCVIADELGINSTNKEIAALCEEIRTRDDYTERLRTLA